MTTNTPPTALTDPESLRDDDAIDVRDETHAVDRGVFLQNDGHHGWTLPAFPVENGEDWYAVARREFEALTGIEISVDAPERLRNRESRLADGDASTMVRDLVVRASPSGDLPDETDSRVDGTEIRWADGVPDGAPDPVGDDVSLFVD